MSNEEKWNVDFNKYISTNIENKDWKVETTLIPLNCYFSNTKKCLMINFSQRDSVIYKEEIDISQKGSGVVFENTSNSQKKSNKIPIPKIVIELKFNRPTRDCIVKESTIANSVKNIFNDCKYLLIVYNSSFLEDTLLKNGISFDKIFVLKNVKSFPKNYEAEMFQTDLLNDNFKSKIDSIIHYINHELSQNKVEI